MYERLTKYAGTLANRELGNELGGGTLGMDDFIEDFYALEGFADTGYFATLERYGAGAAGGVAACDVEHADLDLLRACVIWCVRGDRFCDGLLKVYAENGILDRCLMRLRELDRD